MDRKTLLLVLKVVFSLLAFGFLFSQLDLASVWNQVLGANMLYLLLSVVTVVIMHGCTMLGFDALLSAVDRDLSWTYLFRLTLFTQSVGLMLPGKLGDLSLVYFLRRKGLSYSESTSVFIVDKLISTFVFALIALVGMVALLPMQQYAVMVLLGLLVLLLVSFAYVETWMGLISQLVPSHLSEYWHEFEESIVVIQKNMRSVAVNTMITVFKVLIIGLGSILIFWAFSTDVPFYGVVFVIAITSILSLVPISVSGLGIRELTGTYLHNFLFGIPVEVAGTIMLMHTARNYVMAAALYFGNIQLLSDSYHKE